MKKILIMALLLSGCARLSFDGTEFDQLITINETATLLGATCGSQDQTVKINKLKQEINHFNRYETLRTSRKEVAIVSAELNSLVNELAAKYEKNIPSSVYCVEKLKMVVDGSNTIISALGAL